MTAPLARWDVGLPVYSIAVSHDGTRVVSGSSGYHIQVWDLATGALVLHPVDGHINGITSVAFSPNDTRIVSGSSDGTICFWDTRDGARIGRPLKRHTDVVCSVAFSSHGALVASGSLDRTIRIWNSRTRRPVGEPLRGHTGRVWSAAFSSDNSCLISGSEDGTIRIWNTHTGAPIGEPLTKHTGTVYSVAFSPNNLLFVSGSHDKTIRIWDAQTNTPIGDPLQGHMKGVLSVAFSPDGNCIVSGSHDGAIRVWDTHTRTLLGEPFTGHTNIVSSVVFSPDSTRIISGSWDGTIRVWEAPSATPSFDLVTSQMSAQEMSDCLVKHGCKTLNLSKNIDQRSSAVIASGGFGDIRRLTLEDGTRVAVKTLRLHVLLKDDKAAKRAAREVYVWSKLHHLNVQKLLGIVTFQGELGMVSLWMEKGNLQNFIEAHPDVERHPLCVQLTSGLSHLHCIGIVHGDLKASNVLVSDDETLKITDFDYAMIYDATLRFSTTTRLGGGTLRWMAPELFQPEDDEDDEGGGEGEVKPMPVRSKQTDVYALGMTMLEVITGAVPYSEYKSDVGIYRAIDKKQPPRRPVELSGPDEQTAMWELLLRCWDHDPLARPTAFSVLVELQSFFTE